MRSSGLDRKEKGAKMKRVKDKDRMQKMERGELEKKEETEFADKTWKEGLGRIRGKRR